MQTEDLPIEPGKEVWITVQENGNAKVDYELPNPVASGECGDKLIWKLDKNGVLTISGDGEMWDFALNSAPWSGEANNIQALSLPYGITSIGEYAFQGCCNLSDSTIPSSVTKIGNGAFSSCSSLTEIRFEGAAPGFGSDVFSGVNATACYPAGDDSWTDAVRQNYGGTVTWKAYELPGIPVNASYFPDPIFRVYVSQHFDADKDGYLSEEESTSVIGIYLAESGVVSLEGIQLFTELEELNAGGDFMTAGRLTRVDLSANTKLKILNLGFNPLEGLDVTMLPGLESLMVGFCGLTKLDLSGNPALKELWCDNNDLSELDLSVNPLLEHLDCCGNEKLAVLDIRPCPSLVADYQAGGRHISWMQEEMPEMYESIWVYGGTGDDDYHLAVNSWTEIIAPAPAFTPGDINGDGALNNKDVTRLIRYIKYGDVDAVEAALDVNGDGKLNNKDVTRLIRYIKYGDVDIF